MASGVRGFSTNNKANIPKKTLVINVQKNEVAMLLTMIDAYNTADLPGVLRSFLDTAATQLRASRD